MQSYIYKLNAHNTCKSQLSLGSFSFLSLILKVISSERSLIERLHFVSYVMSLWR